MTNKELIDLAASVVTDLKLSYDNSAGGVGCALFAENDKIYTGVCIDTSSSMGFCAEHNAIGSMITDKESHIKKIVAVKKDEKGHIEIIYPCGRCREFMRQINQKNMDTEIIVDENKILFLSELLPY